MNALDERTTKPNDLAAVRMALRGEYVCNVLGERIVLCTWTGPRLPQISSLAVRDTIKRRAWLGYVESMRWVFEKAVVSWGELTYTDLWRDPEIALNLYRTIRAN